MIKIDLGELAKLTTAISHYTELASYLPQLDPKQRDTLVEAYKKCVKHSRDGLHMDYQSGQYWNDINLYVVNQLWGNTSCGWEGFGGAAMSNSYTTIIENKWNELAFIYYNGQLAYIVNIDDSYNQIKSKGFSNMPGLRSCKSKLSIVYTKN